MDILSPPEKTKVEVIQGDITDYSGVLEASRGVDVIIHTASLVDVWHKIPDSLIHSVNINGETPTGPGRKKIRGGEETSLASWMPQTRGNALQLWGSFKDFYQLVVYVLLDAIAQQQS